MTFPAEQPNKIVCKLFAYDSQTVKCRKKLTKQHYFMLEKCIIYINNTLEKCKKSWWFIVEKCVLFGACACI